MVKGNGTSLSAAVAGTDYVIPSGSVQAANQFVTARTIAMTGDVSWTSASFNGTANVTGTATLANSGVTAGTYKSVTVDAKGRVTSGTNPTTVAGYGITDAIVKTGATGGAYLPSGTTAQRPTGVTGTIRYNSTLSRFEGYGSSAWGSLGGATGGGSDDVFYENSRFVNTNYTISTGKNAMSAGPIIIADGVTVTIGDDSTWVVV
jgi:phage-related tail fiber protein